MKLVLIEKHHLVNLKQLSHSIEKAKKYHLVPHNLLTKNVILKVLTKIIVVLFQQIMEFLSLQMLPYFLKNKMNRALK